MKSFGLTICRMVSFTWLATEEMISRASVSWVCEVYDTQESGGGGRGMEGGRVGEGGGSGGGGKM